MSLNSELDLIRRAQILTRAYGKIWDERLGRIITFWIGPPPVFPAKKNRKKLLAVSDVDDEYLLYYIKRYYSERDGTVIIQLVQLSLITS